MSSPPKTRHKFELLLSDIQKYLLAPYDADRASRLYTAASNVQRFVDALVYDVARTRALLTTIHDLRVSGGAGAQVAEERMMEVLRYLARQCRDLTLGEYEVEVPRSPPIRLSEASRAQVLEVLREVCAFSHACFDFRRPRDAFAGRRRLLAFSILGAAAPVVVEPAWVDRAEAVVRSGRDAELRGALDFIAALVPREDNTFYGDYVEDEADALDRIDEWREERARAAAGPAARGSAPTSPQP
jgi:hypothetical protein